MFEQRVIRIKNLTKKTVHEKWTFHENRIPTNKSTLKVSYFDQSENLCNVNQEFEPSYFDQFEDAYNINDATEEN